MKRGWIIFLIVVAALGFLLVAFGDTVPDDTAVIYGGAELSPLTQAYQLWGWNIPVITITCSSTCSPVIRGW